MLISSDVPHAVTSHQGEMNMIQSLWLSLWNVMRLWNVMIARIVKLYYERVPPKYDREGFFKVKMSCSLH